VVPSFQYKGFRCVKLTYELVSLDTNYLNPRLEIVGLLEQPQNRELQNMFCKVAAHLISMLQPEQGIIKRLS